MSDANHDQSLLPAEWNIPGVLRQRLGNDVGRQRILHHDGHLLLVLHSPPQPGEHERRGRFFWRMPDGGWEMAPLGDGAESLSSHLHEYQAAIEQLHRDEEAADTCEEYFDVISRLTPLVRATRNLYNTLQKAREAVPEERRLIIARDRAYTLARRVELLYEDAKNALDFAVAQQTESHAESSHQMSVASHRLNVLVALFFPLATLMAVFGANLHHGLENWDTSQRPWALFAVIGAGLALGVIITWFVTRPAPRPRNPYLRSKKRDHG